MASTAPQRNHSQGNQTQQTFGRSMMSYIQNRLPYNLQFIHPKDSNNPKYDVFRDAGARKPELLAKHSVSSNTDYNNLDLGMIESDKSFADVMYANIQNDKGARMRDYRTMAAYSKVVDALDEICDEFINIDDKGRIAKLNINEIDLESAQKETLEEELKTYIQHFDLKNRGWQYFRQFIVEGEIFFELIIHQQHANSGVLGVINVPSELIDPVYNNIQNMLIKGFIYKKPIFDPNNPSKVEKYEFIPMSENQIVYINSGVFNEDKSIILPFLENARRAYRQLSLIEDAIVIYRLVRAPERLVFNVDVGTMAPPKAEAYLRKLSHQYWSSKTYDTGNGDISQKFTPQSMLDAFWFAKRQGSEGSTVTQLPGGCLSMDTKVPLLDGRILTIEQIEQELKKQDVWVYSCDPFTGKIAPGKVDWAGVTQESAEVLKITLDNGEHLICTPDHKFPLRNKGFVEARDLEVGTSMMPFYTKKEFIGDYDYEQIYDNEEKDWKFTHRMVGKFFKSCSQHIEIVYNQSYAHEPKDTIHHYDHNRFNNDPRNLCFMNFMDHRKLHASKRFEPYVGTLAAKKKLEYIKQDPEKWEQYLQQRSETSKKVWQNRDKATYEKTCTAISLGITNYIENLDPEKREKRASICKNNLKKGSAKNKTHQSIIFDEKIQQAVFNLIDRNYKNKQIIRELNSDKELVNHLKEINKDQKIRIWNGIFKLTHLKIIANRNNYESVTHMREDRKVFNHKIINIEYLPERIQVGTLTIDNKEEFHNYHTFAIGCGIFTRNSNLGELADLMYFNKELYRALKVPTSRVDPQDAFRDGTDLLREELKFARFIIRQQQRFANGMKKGFITHLKLKGLWSQFELREDDFDIEFNVPTNFYELRESQRLEMKANNYNALASSEFISPTMSQKKYLGWNDKEILANRDFMRTDAAFRWELAQIEGGGPNWQANAAQAAEAAGEGSETGMTGGSGGFGPVPDFGGGPALEVEPDSEPEGEVEPTDTSSQSEQQSQ